MFDALIDATSTTNDFDDRPARAGTAAPGTECAPIRLHALAAMLGATMDGAPNVSDITFPVRRLKVGQVLYRAGDRFDAIYVIRSGFCKTVSVDAGGDELVLGFPMGGDVVGLDGVDQGEYTADVVAIDMCSVVVIPFARLARLARELPCVEKMLYAAFGRELVAQRRMVRLLGTLSAEARLATFLLDLSERFGRLGYSRTAFALRMTRMEIGSYLGMKLETVSRMFSSFAATGLLRVERKEVVLHDVDALRLVAASSASRAAA